LADNLELDPITITRNDNDFDYGGLLELVQRNTWFVIILGILLQVVAWFLSVATQWQRVLRLGIRLFLGGVAFLGIVLVVRSRISQSSPDNKAVIDGVTQILTDPMLTRFIVMIVLGVITGALGLAMTRKTAPSVS
jgi:hypothetical protein